MQLKDYSGYLLNDAKDSLREKILENVMNDDNNMDENIGKVLFLTTELMEKDKKKGMMKTSIDEKMKN